MTIKRRQKLFSKGTWWLDAIGLFIFAVTLTVITAAVIKHFATK